MTLLVIGFVIEASERRLEITNKATKSATKQKNRSRSYSAGTEKGRKKLMNPSSLGIVMVLLSMVYAVCNESTQDGAGGALSVLISAENLPHLGQINHGLSTDRSFRSSPAVVRGCSQDPHKYKSNLPGRKHALRTRS